MTNDKTLSRKEREKQGRKREIQDAAIKLFAEKGFANTTLDDIAAESEFGKGTIYNYFTSKEELINSIIENVLGHNLESLKEADASAPLFKDFLKLYTRKILECCALNKEAFMLLAEYYIQQVRRGQPAKLKDAFSKLHSEIDQILVRRIEKAIKSKEIKNVNANQLHMIYHHMVFPYSLDLIHHDCLNKMTVENHVEFINDLIFNGISKR